MSLLKVDTVQGRSGTDISVASGHTLKNASGKALSNGLLEFDQWAMTANQDGNGNNILLQNNLARPTGKLQGGYKGNGMTVSSGIWTFPSTGFWLVRVIATFEVNDDFAAEVVIEATDDNSSYDRIARCDAGTRANIGRLHTSSCEVIIDVTDTSNHKVKFLADSMSASSDIIGSSAEIYTGFTFMKLADT